LFDHCVKKIMRKLGGRLLVVPGLVLMAMSLSPARAEAGIRCFARHYIVCTHFECCFVTCVICQDSDGNIVATDCVADTCYPRVY
jgi:hypothetical protein